MMEPGVRSQFKVSRERKRHPPLEYSEAVEKWARGNGGHASLKWLEDPMNCWAVILTYKTNDPRKLIHDGPQADGEPVLLHEWWTAEQWQKRRPKMARRDSQGRIMAGSYSFDLDELGIEGIIQWLDRGNILSGRGEFKSAEQAMSVQRDKHKALRERDRLNRRDDAKHLAGEARRQVYKIPFLPVGIELSKETTSR